MHVIIMCVRVHGNLYYYHRKYSEYKFSIIIVHIICLSGVLFYHYTIDCPIKERIYDIVHTVWTFAPLLTINVCV